MSVLGGVQFEAATAIACLCLRAVYCTTSGGWKLPRSLVISLSPCDGRSKLLNQFAPQKKKKKEGIKRRRGMKE
jgi:hypothetical protein